MSKDKKQIKCSFYAEQSVMLSYEKIKSLMVARGIETSYGNSLSQSDVMRYALEHFFSGNTGGGRKKTGAGESVLNRINDVALKQININETTKQTTTVGVGNNQVTIKYEQRTITSRLLREGSKANAAAVSDYINKNKDMLEKHNQWIIDNCGYDVNPDNDKAILNYNRRTSKAQLQVNAEL